MTIYASPVPTEREVMMCPGQGTGRAPGMFAAPPGAAAVPAYDRGWLVGAAERRPFLSYVDVEPRVNWSEELEALHEHASRTHFMDRWTRSAIVERLQGLRPAATIADIGCSTGFLLEDLQAAYPEAMLIGVDLVAAGLGKAHRELPAARLLHADVCSLPLADASVDAVASANLLEHVPEDQRALGEIARVLRPGGRAAIVVPAGPRAFDYYDRFLGHERRYARGELASKCRQAGLDVLEDAHIAALLYPAFWMVKQRNRRRHANLSGEALEARVTADIRRSRDSRVGRLTRRLEQDLNRAGVRLPFGIRSLVVARRPGAPT